MPKPCRRALDVGCGLGSFARRLSSFADHVDAIDRNASVIRQARQLSTDMTNVQFLIADFMSWEAEKPYDFISMIATVHHLPFGKALTRAANLLAPGGVLVILGLDKATSVLHLCARAPIAYTLSAYYQVSRRTSPVGAPILEPTMTLSEIRRQADELLPAAIVRRHWLLRYSLVWTKP